MDIAASFSSNNNVKPKSVEVTMNGLLIQSYCSGFSDRIYDLFHLCGFYLLKETFQNYIR